MLIASVSRCLAVLEILSTCVEEVDLAALAKHLSMPSSAVQRLLSTLKSEGWVIQDPESRKYRLSLRMSTLAFRNIDHLKVPDVAQPILDSLASSTSEYCRLAVVAQQTLVWAAKAQGAIGGLRYDPDTKTEVVPYMSAEGLIWLSTMPEEKAVRLVYPRQSKNEGKLASKFVARAIDFRAKLSETKKIGYALASEAAEPGISTLAVSFLSTPSEDAHVAGTVSVSAPTFRINPGRQEELALKLQAAAEELQRIWPVRARQRSLR